MSSKVFRMVILSVCSVAMAGCGQFLQDKKRDQKVVEISNKEQICLSEISQTISLALDTEAGEQKIRNGMGCLREALTSFSQNAKGQQGETYAVADLELFFTKYVLHGKAIPPGLLSGLMKLKSALLGGTSSYFTRAELMRFVALLRDIEEDLVRIEKFLPVIAQRTKTQVVAESDIDRAAQQVELTIENLLRRTDLSHSDYSFADFCELLVDLSAFMEGEIDGVTWVSKVRQHIPLLLAMKEVLFGEVSRLKGQRDWENAIHSTVSMGALAYKKIYLYDQAPSSERSDLTLRLADQALTQLERSHSLNVQGGIPFPVIDKAISELIQLGMVPKNWANVDILSDFLEKFSVRVLDPLRQRASGLTLVHVSTIRREFDLFYMIQDFLNSQVKGQISWAELEKAARVYPFAEKIQKKKRPFLDVQLIKTGWAEFQKILARPRPIAFSQSGKILVLPDMRGIPQTIEGLRSLNIGYSLARVFMLGYGDTSDPVLSHADRDGFFRWYADFKQFGDMTGIFDPRSENSGPRSFNESNYLTPSGDGNKETNFTEMVELTSAMYGGGVGTARHIRSLLASNQNTCGMNSLDIFGEELQREPCVSEFLRAHFAEIFDDMPGMAGFVKGMNDQTWREFYQIWMELSRSSDPKSGSVEINDIRTGVLIFYYVETLFVQNDQNGDGVLDRDEITKGSVRFISLIREIGGASTDWLAQKAFIAMVLNGERPSAGDIASDVSSSVSSKLRNWAGFGKSSSKTATRMNILRVLKALKADFEGSASVPAP